MPILTVPAACADDIEIRAAAAAIAAAIIADGFVTSSSRGLNFCDAVAAAAIVGAAAAH